MLVTRIRGHRVALSEMPSGVGPKVWAAEVRDEAGLPTRGRLMPEAPVDDLRRVGNPHGLVLHGASLADVLSGLDLMLPRFKAAS